jgi:hypothetical protein
MSEAVRCRNEKHLDSVNNYETVENGAGFDTMERKSSGLPGGWNDIRGVFGFSVAAGGLAGRRESRTG